MSLRQAHTLVEWVPSQSNKTLSFIVGCGIHVRAFILQGSVLWSLTLACVLAKFKPNAFQFWPHQIFKCTPPDKNRSGKDASVTTTFFGFWFQDLMENTTGPATTRSAEEHSSRPSISRHSCCDTIRTCRPSRSRTTTCQPMSSSLSETMDTPVGAMWL